MSIVEAIVGRNGTESACHALYCPRTDSWATCDVDGAECVVLFQTFSQAAGYLEKIARSDKSARESVVVKIAPSDVAAKVASARGAVCGVFLIATSGQTQRVIVRDPGNRAIN